MTNVLADWINCGREWPATIKTFEKNALVLKQDGERFFFAELVKEYIACRLRSAA